MTTEEKRKAIGYYCDKQKFCSMGHSTPEGKCPLYSIACSTRGDVEMIDRNYDILVQAGAIPRPDPEIVPASEATPDPKANPAPEFDPVNRPKHYNREGAMESIDEMVLVFGPEAVMHFCLCNAWKYRYRATNKNGEEDLKKSDWYMRKYKELKEAGHDPT